MGILILRRNRIKNEPTLIFIQPYQLIEQNYFNFILGRILKTILMNIVRYVIIILNFIFQLIRSVELLCNLKYIKYTLYADFYIMRAAASVLWGAADRQPAE